MKRYLKELIQYSINKKYINRSKAEQILKERKLRYSYQTNTVYNKILNTIINNYK